MSIKITRPMEEILDQFFNNYEKLENMYNHLKHEQGIIDRELSDFYHRMEGIHLSHNTQAHKYMVQLQDILNRRRINKKQGILVRSFLDTTKHSISVAKTKTRKVVKTHNEVIKEIQTLKTRGKMRRHKKSPKKFARLNYLFYICNQINNY